MEKQGSVEVIPGDLAGWQGMIDVVYVLIGGFNNEILLLKYYPRCCVLCFNLVLVSHLFQQIYAGWTRSNNYY